MTTTEVPVKATFSVAVGVLADALARCAAATMTPGSGPLPILSHVALRVQAGELTLFATDLEWGVTVRLPAPHCEGDWTAAIPAGRTAQLLKQFKPTDVVRFTRSPITGHVVEVLLECGRGKFRLKAIEDDSFPEPLAAQPVPLFSARGSFLADSLGRVRLFAARNHDRQILSGVAFNVNEHGVQYLATNTQVVADFVDEAASYPGPYPTERVVIPMAVCHQIELAASACGEDIVRVYPVGRPDSPRGLVFECPPSPPLAVDAAPDAPPPPRTTSVSVFARTMEGVYPDVTGKILSQLPGSAETTAIVRPKAMLDALARVGTVAEVNQYGYTSVSLTPLVEEGAIRIHARGVQAGEGTDIVYAEVTGVSDQAHLFHLGNLKAVLRAVSRKQPDDQTVTIQFRTLKPALFTGGVPGYTQALFPMRAV